LRSSGKLIVRGFRGGQWIGGAEAPTGEGPIAGASALQQLTPLQLRSRRYGRIDDRAVSRLG